MDQAVTVGPHFCVNKCSKSQSAKEAQNLYVPLQDSTLSALIPCSSLIPHAGAGKSSLVTAPLWALTGDTLARTGVRRHHVFASYKLFLHWHWQVLCLLACLAVNENYACLGLLTYFCTCLPPSCSQDGKDMGGVAAMLNDDCQQARVVLRGSVNDQSFEVERVVKVSCAVE